MTNASVVDVTGVAVSPRSTRPRDAVKPSRYLLAALCCAIIAMMLFPILMAFLTSIKTPEAAMSTPPSYLPTALSLQSYLHIYNYQAGLPTYLFNSFAVALSTIILCVILSVTAGYGLARFNIPFKEPLFLVLLSGMMIPYQALLTPLYLLYVKLGLQQTLFGLALIHTALQLPFSIFLMRSSFEAVPRELEEAAVVDGCNSFETLWRVFLPAAIPGMVTVALFAFVNSWNEFIAALIFMNKESSFTVPIMLVSSRIGHYGLVDWGALQAGVIISIVPCVLVYVFLQKYYVSGFLNGAIK
jgi:multiple sugar transport system permease protein